MDPARYEAFTRCLLDRLAMDERVLALVALGSMAARDTAPDRWSDHDFFVVTVPGAQAALRSDLSWLPDAAAVALAFQETPHGLKVLYDDGHLLEFAVFDPDELALARVNRRRVLLDRADVAARLERVAERTAAEVRSSASDDRVLFGQLLCQLQVGVGRAARGEALSGRHFVLDLALRTLLVLLARHVRAAGGELLDDLDPWRRFERVHPALGRELAATSLLPTQAAAAALLALAERELAPLAATDARGVAALRLVLREAAAP